MQTSEESNGSSAWPTAMATFVVLALVVSVVSLGAVIHKTNGTTVVAGLDGRRRPPRLRDSISARTRPTRSRRAIRRHRRRARSPPARCTS